MSKRLEDLRTTSAALAEARERYDALRAMRDRQIGAALRGKTPPRQCDIARAAGVDEKHVRRVRIGAVR